MWLLREDFGFAPELCHAACGMPTVDADEFQWEYNARNLTADG